MYTKKVNVTSQEIDMSYPWWYMPVITEFQNFRQICELKASQEYVVTRPCLKSNSKIRWMW